MSRWIVGVLLLVLGVVVYQGVLATTFPSDENLVRTERMARTGPPGGGSIQGLLWKMQDVKRRLRPNPWSVWFSATETQRCSIDGLLKQCMAVTGTEYIIEKKVAGGNVMFGSTNVLNGLQWVRAFENALQTNSPRWYDFKSDEFQSENLVLLRFNKKTILVLTPATAVKYREKYPKLAPLER